MFERTTRPGCRADHKPAIQQLGARCGEHDIPRLEVTVHDARAVRLLQRIADLYCALQRLLQGQRSFV